MADAPSERDTKQQPEAWKRGLDTWRFGICRRCGAETEYGRCEPCKKGMKPK